ncbi:MAG: recombinase zinc beta ribbon domain-containing protein [Bacteroidetes bacterium]|nr:recombinase zinc beta ribbon domain-containing protein [Bacteroidota bacterium]
MYKGIRKWRRNEDKVEIIDGKVKKIKVVVEEITSSVPPIVNVDLWDKVNRNFENNKKNVGKKAQYKYLLNGLIVCADCDRDFVGKKRLSSGDNAYKCKGKFYPHPDCTTSRGISINKLDSFIIKHLFISKSLKRHLQQLPENNTAKNNLLSRLTNETGVLNMKSAELELAYKRLLNPDFKDDKHIESHVITLRNVVDRQQRLVDSLTNEVNMVEQSARKKRVNDLMKGYFEGIDFDSVKQLIHSLIERIKIKHYKREGKTGEFLLKLSIKVVVELSKCCN